MKNTFLKIVLILFVALGTSFATENYDDDWERRVVPKKFLNKDCKKLAKKIWVETKFTYYETTILDVWKDYVLMLFFPPKPELKDIERMKNIRYITHDVNNYSYDFDFKWINKNTLLIQLFDTDPENSCELWLFEEKNSNVDVYKFTSRYLPD